MNLELISDNNNFYSAYLIWKQLNRDISFNDFSKRWHESNLYLIKEKNNNIIGFILITTRNEIGYHVLRHYQRRGFASNAIKEIMKIEKRKYYWALIDFDNEKSIRLVQSLGFIPKSLVYSKQND